MALSDLVVGIKGAGEMASAVAVRLYKAGICKIFMMEIDRPLAIRRGVCFSEAVYENTMSVEGVESNLAQDETAVGDVWKSEKIAVLVDPRWQSIQRWKPHGVVDAILAKKNLGTRMNEASLVIGLGPGFVAGVDVHKVIETQRGHHLGGIIEKGGAVPDTGVPGNIGGYTVERLLRAPVTGILESVCRIGDAIRKGEVAATISGRPVIASIDGVIRGLIRPGTLVRERMKIGDIDPRNKKEYCFTISDKARAIAGSVLEAVCRFYSREFES